MSRVCTISKKRRHVGNNVSHANNKTKKVWNVNLKKKRVFDSQSGEWVTLRVSARMLRSIDKKGLAQTLKDNGLKISDVRS